MTTHTLKDRKILVQRFSLTRSSIGRFTEGKDLLHLGGICLLALLHAKAGSQHCLLIQQPIDSIGSIESKLFFEGQSS